MSRLLTFAAAAQLVGKDRSAIAYRVRKGLLPVVEEANTWRGVTRYVREEDVLATDWKPSHPAPKKRVQTTARVPLVPRDAARRVLAPPPLVGACRGSDLDWFAEDAEAEQACHAVCLRCDVFAKCREWFLGREEFGFGGGMSAKQRVEWRRSNGVTVTGAVTIR